MKSYPRVCPKCAAAGSYYGRLCFPADPEPAMCPHHPAVELVAPNIPATTGTPAVTVVAGSLFNGVPTTLNKLR